MTTRIPAVLLGWWLCSSLPARAADVTARTEGDSCIVAWRSDEAIEVSFSRTAGVVRSPVKIKVGDRSVSFDGFYLELNGEREGYTSRSVKTTTGRGSIEIAQLLDHPRLPSPVRVGFKISMVPENKAIRFRVDTSNGASVHLDRLGLGRHQGTGLEPRRMFFGKMWALDGPIERFKLDYTYNSARFWAFTMANGLTELIGADSTPREFDFDPAAGTYDMPTYCDSPITYTFVLTALGAQEAMSQYRAATEIAAPPTLAQLPGRVTVMTAHPIPERYEDYLDELTGRGLRDFIWLSYAPWPGDRDRVAPFGALYSVYDMYTDMFDTGPRAAEGWTPAWARYDKPGHIERGYWNAARTLPDVYVEMAQKRVMGVLGRELENRGFLKTEYTKYSNLAITKREVQPTALYFDVHSSKVPRHYWDHAGKHHTVADAMRHEKALFDFARQYLGNVPVFSEIDGEAFVGIMDAGIFHQWPTLEKVGVKARAWDYYPSIEVVHRGRVLNSGAGWPFALDDYSAEGMATAIQFGRPQVLSAYWGTPLTHPGGQARLYYLSSAFHRMLGLSRMERVDFDGDSLHRQIASYSNGARTWVNRGAADWEVEGLTLPQWGYVVKGPGDFMQYRARKGEQIVETVQSRDYYYASADKAHDFGAVIANGALAARSSAPDRVILYELQKPSGEVRFRLGQLPGTAQGRKVLRAWALMTRGRRIEIKFPDLRQEGDTVRFHPTAMATTVGYEFELGKP